MLMHKIGYAIGVALPWVVLAGIAWWLIKGRKNK